jgi:hypothetical protein
MKQLAANRVFERPYQLPTTVSATFSSAAAAAQLRWQCGRLKRAQHTQMAGELSFFRPNLSV